MHSLKRLLMTLAALAAILIPTGCGTNQLRTPNVKADGPGAVNVYESDVTYYTGQVMPNEVQINKDGVLYFGQPGTTIMYDPISGMVSYNSFADFNAETIDMDKDHLSMTGVRATQAKPQDQINALTAQVQALAQVQTRFIETVFPLLEQIARAFSPMPDIDIGSSPVTGDDN